MKTQDIIDHCNANGDNAFFAAAIHYVSRSSRFAGSGQLTKVRFKGKGKWDSGLKVEVADPDAPNAGREYTIRPQDVICTWTEQEREAAEIAEIKQQEAEHKSLLRETGAEFLDAAGIDHGNVPPGALRKVGMMVEANAIVRTIQPHVYVMESGHVTRTVVHLLDDKKFKVIDPGHWREADTNRAALLLVKAHVKQQKEA